MYKVYQYYADINCIKIKKVRQDAAPIFQGGKFMIRKDKWTRIKKSLIISAAFGVSVIVAPMCTAYGEGDSSSTTGSTCVVYDSERITAFTDKNSNSTKDNDEEGYYFFTISKVTEKSIPAANKWEKTTGGMVDVSEWSQGKTVYFANSTTPAYDDVITVVVPAQPKFKTLKYVATGTSAYEMLGKPVVTVKCVDGNKEKNTNITLAEADMTNIEYRKKDRDAFTPVKTSSNDNLKESIDLFKKSGATVEFRTKASATTEVTATKQENGTYAFSSAEVPSGAKDSNCVAGAFLRPGVVKSVKVSKVSSAPAVSVDFENHCFIVKKGQEYAKCDAFTAGVYTPVTETTKVYFNDDETYAVRTAATTKKTASLDTYITTGTTKTFKDAFGTDNTVTINAGNSSTMTISRTASDGKTENTKKTPKTTYQYAVIEEADMNEYVNSADNTLNYEALDKAKSGKKISWKNVSIGAGKSSVSVKLSKLVSGKTAPVVLVRGAKAKNVLSSQCVVLTATLGEKEVTGWTQRAQAETDARACLSISGNKSDFTYDVLKGQIVVIASGVEALGEEIETKTVKIKVGSSEIDSTMTVKNNTATINVPYKPTSTTKVSKVKITIPANTLKGVDGVGNAELKVSNVSIDPVRPEVECTVVESGKITFKFSKDIQVDGKDISEDNISIAKGDDKVAVTSATYNKKKKTLVVEFTADTAYDGSYTIAFTGLESTSGNPAKGKRGVAESSSEDDAGSKITFMVKNAAYVNETTENGTESGNED